MTKRDRTAVEAYGRFAAQPGDAPSRKLHPTALELFSPLVASAVPITKAQARKLIDQWLDGKTSQHSLQAGLVWVALAWSRDVGAGVLITSLVHSGDVRGHSVCLVT